MPRCGATFDEKSVPPWTRGGLQGGFERGNKPTRALRAAVAVVRSGADEHGTTAPAVAVGPASPPQLRRAAYFQGSYL